MSEEKIDEMAILTAERLMRSGKAVSDAELRLILAGLMLNVGKMASAFERMEKRIWPEEKIRVMIVDIVAEHCAAHRAGCSASGFWPTCLGRFVRTVLGK